eukprot:m.311028 g.311028  ORF g.311028 m.311028 type:complete len:529 (+) comp58314_c0_seq1:79-1665(+)
MLKAFLLAISALAISTTGQVRFAGEHFIFFHPSAAEPNSQTVSLHFATQEDSAVRIKITESNGKKNIHHLTAVKGKATEWIIVPYTCSITIRTETGLITVHVVYRNAEGGTYSVFQLMPVRLMAKNYLIVVPEDGGQVQQVIYVVARHLKQNVDLLLKHSGKADVFVDGGRFSSGKQIDFVLSSGKVAEIKGVGLSGSILSGSDPVSVFVGYSRLEEGNFIMLQLPGIKMLCHRYFIAPPSTQTVLKFGRRTESTFVNVTEEAAGKVRRFLFEGVHVAPVGINGFTQIRGLLANTRELLHKKTKVAVAVINVGPLESWSVLSQCEDVEKKQYHVFHPKSPDKGMAYVTEVIVTAYDKTPDISFDGRPLNLSWIAENTLVHHASFEIRSIQENVHLVAGTGSFDLSSYRYKMMPVESSPSVGNSESNDCVGEGIRQRLLDWFHVLKELSTGARREDIGLPKENNKEMQTDDSSWFFNLYDASKDGMLSVEELGYIQRGLRGTACFEQFFQGCFDVENAINKDDWLKCFA